MEGDDGDGGVVLAREQADPRLAISGVPHRFRALFPNAIGLALFDERGSVRGLCAHADEMPVAPVASAATSDIPKRADRPTFLTHGKPTSRSRTGF